MGNDDDDRQELLELAGRLEGRVEGFVVKVLLVSISTC